MRTGWENLWLGHDIKNMNIKEKRQLSFNTCKELLYKVVEEKTGFSKENIFAKKKIRPLANTRRVVVKILKLNFPHAKVILLGATVNRDHSSVSIQLKKHNDLMSSDSDYNCLFNLINDEFNKMHKIYSIDDLRTIKKNLEEQLNYVIISIYQLESKNVFECVV